MFNSQWYGWAEQLPDAFKLKAVAIYDVIEGTKLRGSVEGLGQDGVPRPAWQVPRA